MTDRTRLTSNRAASQYDLAVLTFLADRHALAPKSRQQLLHERQYPWDKL